MTRIMIMCAHLKLTISVHVGVGNCFLVNSQLAWVKKFQFTELNVNKSLLTSCTNKNVYNFWISTSAYRLQTVTWRYYIYRCSEYSVDSILLYIILPCNIYIRNKIQIYKLMIMRFKNVCYKYLK